MVKRLETKSNIFYDKKILALKAKQKYDAKSF